MIDRLEARLSEGSRPNPPSPLGMVLVATPNSSAAGSPPETRESTVLQVDGPALDGPNLSDEETGVSWPDETAESSFRSEARERGEPVASIKSREVADETDSKPLPPLSELVERIPPGVREALEDLFRARFTAVRRIPRQALKD